MEETPDPTPEEIRAACLEIQSTWSENERHKRRFGPKDSRKITRGEIEKQPGWMPHIISTTETRKASAVR